MELTPTERMLLEELVLRQQAAVAPIQARIDATLVEIAARVDIPVESLRIDLANGVITDARATDVTLSAEDSA